MAEEEWSFAEGPVSTSDPFVLFSHWARHLEQAASVLVRDRLGLSISHGRRLEALSVFKRAPTHLGPGLDAWLASEYETIRSLVAREAEYAEERGGLRTRRAQTMLSFQGHSLSLRDLLPRALRVAPELRASLMDLRLQEGWVLGEYRRRLLEGRAEHKDAANERSRRGSSLLLLPDAVPQPDRTEEEIKSETDLELSVRVLEELLKHQESPRDAGEFLARLCFLGSEGEYPARLDAAAISEMLGGQSFRHGLELPAFPLPPRLSPGSFFLALERATRAEWVAYAPSRGSLDFALGAEIWGSLPLARGGRAAFAAQVLSVPRHKQSAHRRAARAALVSELLLLSLRVRVDEAYRRGTKLEGEELNYHGQEVIGRGVSQAQLAGLLTGVSAPGSLLRARLLGAAWDRWLMDLYDEDYFRDPRAIGELRARLVAGVEFAADTDACARGLAAILADE